MMIIAVCPDTATSRHDPDPNDALPAVFQDIIGQFDHLQALGVNALQLMPVAEFADDRSWGYNPAHIFAGEPVYGGPKAFKESVKSAHQNGFAATEGDVVVEPHGCDNPPASAAVNIGPYSVLVFSQDPP